MPVVTDALGRDQVNPRATWLVMASWYGTDVPSRLAASSASMAAWRF
jgi:hypothetical protein